MSGKGSRVSGEANKEVKLPDNVITVVILRITLTVAALVVGVFVAFRCLPAPSPRITSWQGKVMYAFRWQVFSFFSVGVGVAIVAFTRLFTPAINPLHPRADQYVGVYTRCLQNTVEQVVLNVPAQLILSGYLESENLRIIPIMVFLFIAGRIAFWWGYPLQRTYGFVMTFIPTAFAYCMNMFFFFTSGPAFRLGDD